MFTTVLSSMLTLVTIIAVGYLLRRLNIITDEITSGLSKLMLTASVPALILSSLQMEFSNEMLVNTGVTLLTSLVIHLVSLLIGFGFAKLLRLDKKSSGVIIFGTAFTNMVYMGFPIMKSIYGSEAIFYASVANIIFITLCFTLGMRVLSDADDKKRIKPRDIITPPFAATIIGLLLFVSSISIPEPLFRACETLGHMTTPLSLIIIGSLLTKCHPADFKDYKLYLFSLVRLIILPLLAFVILRGLIDNKLMLNVIVMTVAMPAASMMPILAIKHGSNEVFASRLVFCSTLLSVVTIPVIVVIMN